MAYRLKQLEVEEVSLVDVPAIGRRFIITKAEKPANTEPGKEDKPEDVNKGGATEVSASAETPTEKSAISFNQLIAAQNLNDRMWDAFYALKESIYTSLSEPNAGELIQSNITQFSAYILGLVSTAAGIAKAKESYPKDEPKEGVEKAGAKISRARMERLTNSLASLKTVAEDLDNLIKEASPADDEEPEADDVQKGGKPTETPSAGEPMADITGAIGALTEMVKSAVSPEKFQTMLDQALQGAASNPEED